MPKTKKRAAKPAPELSDDQLDKVSGGAGIQSVNTLISLIALETADDAVAGATKPAPASHGSKTKT